MSFGSTQRFSPAPVAAAAWTLAMIPEGVRLSAYRSATREGVTLAIYTPEEGLLQPGAEAFSLVRATPDRVWDGLVAQAPGPDPVLATPLTLQVLTQAPWALLQDYFRSVNEQITFVALAPLALAIPLGVLDPLAIHALFLAEALSHLKEGRLSALARNTQIRLASTRPELRFASALRWVLAILHKEPENHAALETLLKRAQIYTRQHPFEGR